RQAPPAAGPPDASAPASTTPLDVLDDRFDLPQSPDSPTITTTIPADESSPDTTTTTVAARPEDLPPAVPADGSPIQQGQTSPTPTVTTSTIPASSIEKEFGALRGDGQGKLPKVELLQDNPSLSILQVGDRVATAGGSGSLAPADIPIGVVVNRINRPGVGGPVLEIALYADLEQLGAVQVVIFQPREEAG
ncbi:MAG: rod shape-determining protein MreC, partial [Actinomycetota bacterium]